MVVLRGCAVVGLVGIGAAALVSTISPPMGAALALMVVLFVGAAVGATILTHLRAVKRYRRTYDVRD